MTREAFIAYVRNGGRHPAAPVSSPTRRGSADIDAGSDSGQQPEGPDQPLSAEASGEVALPISSPAGAVLLPVLHCTLSCA